MPQLDPTWIPSQVFWLIITFGSMLFLMSKFVIPKIAEVIDDRNKRIDDDLSRAEELKSEADTVLAKYDEAVSAAKKEAEEIIASTKEDIAKFAKTKEEEMDKKLAERIKEGEEKISKVKKDAMEQIKDIVSDTAIISVEKVAGITIEQDVVKKAVNDVIGENI